MRVQFSTIVVPLDLEPSHDRAVPVAGFLADLANLPVVLLTVSSPGMPDQPDEFDLRRTAERHHLERWSAAVLHDNEPHRAIAAHLRTLDAPLVVMASEVGGAMHELVSDDTPAHLLSDITCAALILGPNVPDAWQPAHPQLVCCVAPADRAHIALPWMARWFNTFGGNTPCFVTVIHTGLSNTDASERVQALARDLFATSGITGDWNVTQDDDPVDGVLALTHDNHDAVIVVTTERWSDTSRLHLHSVARRLARSSTKPVLVVPYASAAA